MLMLRTTARFARGFQFVMAVVEDPDYATMAAGVMLTWTGKDNEARQARIQLHGLDRIRSSSARMAFLKDDDSISVSQGRPFGELTLQTQKTAADCSLVTSPSAPRRRTMTLSTSTASISPQWA